MLSLNENNLVFHATLGAKTTQNQYSGKFAHFPRFIRYYFFYYMVLKYLRHTINIKTKQI